MIWIPLLPGLYALAGATAYAFTTQLGTLSHRQCIFSAALWPFTLIAVLHSAIIDRL